MEKDIKKQEQLIELLYEFNNDQIEKKEPCIRYLHLDTGKLRKIYAPRKTFNKIMKLFGYKIIPIN